MIRTRITLATISRIDAVTTLRVDACPTPSVPREVLMPRYEATTAMMNPKTVVLSVDGMRSENSIERERLSQVASQRHCR